MFDFFNLFEAKSHNEVAPNEDRWVVASLDETAYPGIFNKGWAS